MSIKNKLDYKPQDIYYVDYLHNKDVNVLGFTLLERARKRGKEREKILLILRYSVRDPSTIFLVWKSRYSVRDPSITQR